MYVGLAMLRARNVDISDMEDQMSGLQNKPLTSSSISSLLMLDVIY